jgi:Uma2 family endonuclease
MIHQTNIATQLPRTLEEFKEWTPNDGFKYEWNDGELIRFNGMKKEQLYIYQKLNRLFIQAEFWKKGQLVAEQDVQLTGIQMRRPDIAYFTDAQINEGRKGIEPIPAFVIEIISDNDQINKVEDKLIEYFKAGVRVVWHVLPEQKTVYVYTSRKEVKICEGVDICSAYPVLENFEISAEAIFAE